MNRQGYVGDTVSSGEWKRYERGVDAACTEESEGKEGEERVWTAGGSGETEDGSAELRVPRQHAGARLTVTDACVR